MKGLLNSQLKRAKYYRNHEAAKQIQEELERLGESFQVSGFAHPKMVIYTDKEAFKPVISIWGLIPIWVNDKQQLEKTWNSTLNARGETIFEKPSFRDSARNKRCILQIDGFYESHHFNGATYPYYIERKDGELITLAGLWSEWTDKSTGEIINTFTVVTTTGNKLLTKIHNNPKLDGPRMPVILEDDKINDWLKPVYNDSDIKDIKQLIIPFPDDKLKAHTVKKLRGKESPGNTAEASEEFTYEELKNLFENG